LPVDGDSRLRKGLETLAIALYRQEHQCSPTVNFGRMPNGYRMSSGNNARLVAAGKRFRGQRCTEPQENWCPGIPPQGPLGANLHADDWCGHKWNSWVPAARAPRQASVVGLGLYRIRVPGEPGLVYIGEGIVEARLLSHRMKGSSKTHRQANAFSAQELEYSWTLNRGWHRYQRQELETDLIAAHVQLLGFPPEAQFLG
jgi:hypothetical protein